MCGMLEYLLGVGLQKDKPAQVLVSEAPADIEDLHTHVSLGPVHSLLFPSRAIAEIGQTRSPGIQACPVFSSMIAVRYPAFFHELHITFL